MPRWPGQYITLSQGETLTVGSTNAGFDIFDDEYEYEKRPTATIDASDFILDIREYDVPYHVRVAIDKGGYKALLDRVILTVTRCTDWKVVHCRGETRRYFLNLHRRPTHTRGPCRYGLRHRNDEITVEVPRCYHRPDHDGVVHD